MVDTESAAAPVFPTSSFNGNADCGTPDPAEEDRRLVLFRDPWPRCEVTGSSLKFRSGDGATIGMFGPDMEDAISSNGVSTVSGSVARIRLITCLSGEHPPVAYSGVDINHCRNVTSQS